jgi:hypothetical protein
MDRPDLPATQRRPAQPSPQAARRAEHEALDGKLTDATRVDTGSLIGVLRWDVASLKESLSPRQDPGLKAPSRPAQFVASNAAAPALAAITSEPAAWRRAPHPGMSASHTKLTGSSSIAARPTTTANVPAPCWLAGFRPNLKTGSSMLASRGYGVARGIASGVRFATSSRPRSTTRTRLWPKLAGLVSTTTSSYQRGARRGPRGRPHRGRPRRRMIAARQFVFYVPWHSPPPHAKRSCSTNLTPSMCGERRTATGSVCGQPGCQESVGSGRDVGWRWIGSQCDRRCCEGLI